MVNNNGHLQCDVSAFLIEIYEYSWYNKLSIL